MFNDKKYRENPQYEDSIEISGEKWTYTQVLLHAIDAVRFQALRQDGRADCDGGLNALKGLYANLTPDVVTSANKIYRIYLSELDHYYTPGGRRDLVLECLGHLIRYLDLHGILREIRTIERGLSSI